MSSTLEAQVEQLQAKVNLLQTTIESVADGILVIDRHRNVSAYNQKFIQMWSIPESLMQPQVGEERLKFLAAQTKDPDRFLTKVWELFLHHPDAELTDYLELKDGRILERYSQPQWHNSEIIGRLWMFRDVTLQKRAEAMLVRFAAIMDATTDLVALTDAQHQIVYLNRAGRQLLGLEEDETLSDRTIATIYPDWVNRLFQEEVLPKATRDGVWHGEVMMRHRNGLEIPVSLVQLVIKSTEGDVDFYATIARDINERKQAEQALFLSELKYRCLFENSQVGIFRTRLEDGLILEANQRSAEQVGYSSPTELVEQKSILEFYANPADRDWLLGYVQRQGECSSYEVPYRHRNGSIRWSLCSVRLNEEENCLEVVATDITDRKQAEEALRRSELKYRNIFENSQVGIGQTRLEDGLFLDANQRCAEIMGVASAIDLIGKRCTTDFYANPSDRQRIITELEQHGEVRNLELRLQRPDGSTRWSLLSLRPNPREQCLDFVLTDISDRKRLEEELVQSQRFLDTIINSVPIGLFAKDVNNDFRYVLINRSANKIVGFDPEKAIGLNDDDLLPKEQAAFFRQQDLAVIAHGELLEMPETWLESKDYGAVLVQGWKRPLFDEQGRITHLLGIFNDITDRWQREEALRLIVEGTAAKTGDEFFQSCVRYLAEVLRVRYALITEFADTEKNCVRTLATYGGNLFSQNFEYQLQGTPCQQVLQGQTCYYPKGVQQQFPEDALLVEAQLESYLGMPLINTAGAVLGHIAVIDTEPMEDDGGRELILKIFAARAGAELERKQTEEALRIAKDVAESANRAKSSFLANMSHELRTPLNAILGFSQLMERDTTLNARQRDFLTTINRSGEHLLELINDVLEMSKIEAGRIQLYPTSFDLYQLLNTLRDLFRVRAESKRLSLEFQIAPDLPQFVTTDEGKLRQVLINLIGNAIKFTEAGYVRVYAEMRSIATTDPVSSLLTFTIEDTGCGIAETDITTLFQPFVRASQAAMVKEGTGLGLAISWQFVQLMGGEIQVNSTLGQGSTFCFTVQAAFADASELEPILPQRRVRYLAPHQPDYRILVVDDRQENRELIEHFLQTVGFTTRTARNGQEAIEEWQTWQPHLIWMDLRMPVLDGYKATRQIRKAERHRAENLPPCKIIAITASAFEDQKLKILAAGCDDWIRKPVREQTIFDKLTEHLNVQYVYDDEGTLSGQSYQSSPCVDLEASHLNVMPIAWLTELHQAAFAVDSDRILQLIAQVPPLHDTLVAGLTELVRQFYFDEILELVEQAQRNASAQ